jgi:hypothetical protein
MIADHEQHAKKTYLSPQITVISLRPEEAVLANCKSQSSAGPVGAGCQAAGGACRGHGS